jgi:hypothetical protein
VRSSRRSVSPFVARSRLALGRCGIAPPLYPRLRPSGCCNCQARLPSRDRLGQMRTPAHPASRARDRGCSASSPSRAALDRSSIPPAPRGRPQPRFIWTPAASARRSSAHGTSLGRRNRSTTRWPEVTKRPDFTHKRTNHELRRLASGIGRSPERAESVTAFRDRSLGAPDVVPGEVHMLPAERGEVSE